MTAPTLIRRRPIPRTEPAVEPPPTRYLRARRYIYELLHSVEIESRFEFYVRMFIAALISLNVIAVTIDTVDGIHASIGDALHVLEICSVIVFSIEYLLRLWSAVEIPRFRHPVWGRLRYMFTFFALVDLVAVLPFYLPMVTAVDLTFLRGLRLMRLLRLLKLGRYSSSLDMLGRVVKTKKEEMAVSMFVIMLILLLSSSLMYFLEHETQPKAFPHIPAALWWGVATLTTVGYGDIYPVTPVGKLCAAVIALLGIGLVALPSGILVAGFVEELQARKGSKRCPHCGEEI
jgi:voltage-gated potassium channel